MCRCVKKSLNTPEPFVTFEIEQSANRPRHCEFSYFSDGLFLGYLGTPRYCSPRFVVRFRAPLRRVLWCRFVASYCHFEMKVVDMRRPVGFEGSTADFATVVLLGSSALVFCKIDPEFFSEPSVFGSIFFLLWACFSSRHFFLSLYRSAFMRNISFS